MGNIIMMNWVSIDGFYADEDGGIDWIARDPEVDKATHGVGQGQADTMLCGRITYQEMESFWPRAALDPNLPAGVKAMADEVNAMKKVVFSRTLTGVTWENSRLVRDDLVGEVTRLKSESGAEMMLFGSGTVVRQLVEARLIDDYVLIITPVILGKGKKLFEDVSKLGVKLISAKSFDSGNVLLHYKKV